MEDILIIHPQDDSTQFLSKIYENLNNCTVINNPNIGNSQLIKYLKSFNKILILGHGCELGLLCNTDKNHRFNRLLINSKHVQFLRNKFIIGIWCYANEFFKKYGLSGFSTGMFVSDLDEANDYNLPLSIVDINESNNLLSLLLSECINDNKENIFNHLYNGFKLKNKNQIAQFNCEKFKYF